MAAIEEEAAVHKADWALRLINENPTAKPGCLESPMQRADKPDLNGIAADVPCVIYQFLQQPDGSSSFPYISPAAEGLFGMPISDISDPIRLFSRIHPDDLARCRKAISEASSNMDMWSQEFRFTRLDGETVWFFSSSRLIRLPDGSVLLNGVVLDISARKRAEAALRESEKRFRAVVESSPDAIFIQTGGCFAYINPAAISLFGAAEEKLLLGRPVLDLFHPGSRAAISAHIQSFNEDRRSVLKFEEKIVRCDDTEVYAEFLAVPFNFRGEKGALVFARDISNRKSADDALRKSEEWYRNLVLIFSHIIWTYEVDEKRQVVANYGAPLAERLLGLPSGTMPNNFDEYLSYIYFEDLPKVSEELCLTLASPGRESTMDYRLNRVDGTMCWVQSHGISYVKPNGNIVCIGTTHDVTEIKNAEKALKESESKYRFLVENTIDCIWLIDLNFVFRYVNPAIFGMTGFTVEEWVGSNIKEHCDEQNFDKIAAILKKALEQPPDNPSIMCEAIIYKKNGEPLHIEVIGRVLFDSSGKPEALQGVTRDISDLKRPDLSL